MIYEVYIHGPVLEKCDVVIKKVCDIKTAGVNFNTFDFRLFQEKIILIDSGNLGLCIFAIKSHILYSGYINCFI